MDAAILIVDDEPQNVRLLGLMLERAGYRNVIATSDSAAVESAFDRCQPDLVLLDLHMPPPDGFALLDSLRARIDPTDFVPLVVLTADTTAGTSERALAAGAHDFLTKPVRYPELLLRVRNVLALRGRHRELREHDAVVTAELADRTRAESEVRHQRETARRRIEAVLAGDGLAMVFQPVVDLADGTIIGAEALARFTGPPPRGPDRWFAEAADVGLGGALELHALTLAVPALDRMPPGTFLSINASAATILSPDFAALLATTDLSRIVIELTEHEAINDYDRLLAGIEAWRAAGLRIAVDDTGSGFASLQHILRLAPDVVKLDRDLIVGLDRDPSRRALVTALIQFVGEIDAVLIAEGIETRDELAALGRLGARYGQGYLMAKPAPLPLAVNPLLSAAATTEPERPPARRSLAGASRDLRDQATTLRALARSARNANTQDQLHTAADHGRRALTTIDRLIAETQQ